MVEDLQVGRPLPLAPRVRAQLLSRPMINVLYFVVPTGDNTEHHSNRYT